MIGEAELLRLIANRLENSAISFLCEVLGT